MSEAIIPRNAVILNPAHSYRRAPPAVAGCWCPDANLLAYFYDIICQRDAHCPAEYMVQFDAAHVFGAQFILGSDRQWFAPSITDYPPAEGLRASINQQISIGGVQTLPHSDKPNVVIAKAGSSNYGHTLTEILPRLVNLARSPLRDVRLLLPNGMAGFEPTVRSLLGLLGIEADLIFVDEQQVTSVGNLFYIGPVSKHNTRKSQTVLAFRDLVWRSLGITPQPHRRFYIERPPSEQRSLINAPEARAH
jgi:hypothetical protein